MDKETNVDENTETIDARGFTNYSTVIDSYGAKVRVKESSNASGPHVWIFIEGGNVENNDGSTHLDVKQASAARDALTKFIDEAPSRWDIDDVGA